MAITIAAGRRVGIAQKFISRKNPFAKAGAEIAGSAADVFGRADMVVKVKEPQPAERAMLRSGQILFTYLHLAPDPAQTEDLVKSGATCIAYETVTDARGGLPLLKPMSQVAGRMSVQCGAHSLEKENGGRGTLLGGVPGVAPARVVVLGGGSVEGAEGRQDEQALQVCFHCWVFPFSRAVSSDFW